jgi:hypothetical protein
MEVSLVLVPSVNSSVSLEDILRQLFCSASGMGLL